MSKRLNGKTSVVEEDWLKREQALLNEIHFNMAELCNCKNYNGV
jgi:hypothetical protein